MQDDVRIVDGRSEKDFRGSSFSGYKESAVIKKLKQACAERSVEPACFWAAELICAGHFAKLWEHLAISVGERHATASPRVALFLARRFSEFKQIVEAGYAGMELELRNCAQVRKMFAEIIAVLCTARRHHPPQLLTVRTDSDFDLSNLAGRLEATGATFASEVFMPQDPKELFVAVNELCYHLASEQSNTVSACYWIEWICAFIRYSGSRKHHLSCAPRTFAPVDDKLQTDPVWIVWDAIRRAARLRGEAASQCTDALMSLFGLRYTCGCRQRRRPLLYASVSYATEDINFNIPIAPDPEAIQAIVAKAQSVYKEVKKGEIMGSTGTGRSNRDRTAERLLKMNALLGAASK